MPTTCGFPNCKFRSRYRGQEDNRHFYRIPKRPQVLRQRWLLAIGRTEDTVVSQAPKCLWEEKNVKKRVVNSFEIEKEREFRHENTNLLV
ncbi:unnamed protein product [Gongylonema pulchrum]|uniref:THAP-type domain-containing protein n=1 Tax=Gongylonema pulchrum TaxID=637853 RepID=A0A183DSC1_9BILA|nr:unnamed protein product [Gongylonema pulchrum]